MQRVFGRIFGLCFLFSSLSVHSQSCVLDQRNDPVAGGPLTGGFSWISIIPGFASSFLAQQFTPTKAQVAAFDLYVVDFPDVPTSTGSVIRVQLLDASRTVLGTSSGYRLAPAEGDLFEPVLIRLVFTNPIPVIPEQPYFFVPYVAEGDNAAAALGADTYPRGDSWIASGPAPIDFWFREYADLSGDCDRDADGIPDEMDSCPDSPAGGVVNSSGCSISDLAPCAGPFSGGTWKNHSEYVNAIKAIANDFVRLGLISNQEKNLIHQAAASADCGKK